MQVCGLVATYAPSPTIAEVRIPRRHHTKKPMNTGAVLRDMGTLHDNNCLSYIMRPGITRYPLLASAPFK